MTEDQAERSRKRQRWTIPICQACGEVFEAEAPHPHGGMLLDVEVMPIPEEAAVERIARALNLEASRQRGWAVEDDWEEITEQERGGWRLCARAALVALEDRP